MHHQRKDSIVPALGLKTMSGFIVPAGLRTALAHRDGRWYSPAIQEIYTDVANDILDSEDALTVMHKLFKSDGMEALLTSMYTLCAMNKDNEIATIRRYTADHHDFHAYGVPKTWDHMAFVSLIAIIVEDNKGKYTGTKDDRVRLTMSRKLMEDANQNGRHHIAYWLRSAGWRDFIRMAWLVYGDIRQYDADYMNAKKQPRVKVSLG